MKWLVNALMVVASLLYPALWYFGREQGWFAYLAAGMMLLWGARAFLQRDAWWRAISILVALFFAAVLLLRVPQSMYWYPVWVNALMLVLFGSSLFAKQTLIERLARLQTPDLPPSGVAYTRKITQIWCIFFVVNGAIAAILVLLQQFAWWALYTGVIAYVLMGLLLSGEWLYRRFVLRIQ